MSEQKTQTKKSKATPEELLERARENFESKLIAVAVGKTGKTPLAKEINRAVNSGLNRREKSKLTVEQVHSALLKVISHPNLDNIKSAITKLVEKCPEPDLPEPSGD